MIRRFNLHRWRDDSGVSGVGVVLNGVVLPSGRVVIEWREPHRTIAVYDSFLQFKKIHIDAHPNSGEVEWQDEVDA